VAPHASAARFACLGVHVTLPRRKSVSASAVTAKAATSGELVAVVASFLLGGDVRRQLDADLHSAAEGKAVRVSTVPHPASTCSTGPICRRRRMRRPKTSARVNYLLIGVLMAFVAIAAVNSLMMAIGERARELALLRLVGASRRQVIRMIRWEALAVIGFGVLIGLAVAAATLVPFSLAIAETATPNLPWQVVAGVIAGALLLGLGASELPARTGLRRDPIELIGAQE
jgi:putative ABC transport system permease protein